MRRRKGGRGRRNATGEPAARVEEGQRERGCRKGQDLDGSDLVRLRHKATRPQSKQMLLSHPWKRIVKWALTPTSEDAELVFVAQIRSVDGANAGVSLSPPS